MHPNLHLRLRRAGITLALLSLASCGGLPRGGTRSPSTALKNTRGTPLAVTMQPLAAKHPGQSGMHALADARDALAARLALTDAAQRSLDAQYYIWHPDRAGSVMFERLFRAADRGVRVRLLLDDIGTRPPDKVLLAIDSHPNIEVRMFNPVHLRSPRWLGFVSDLPRSNRRMHNKSLIADGQVAIVGGRNIGDEYFGASSGPNFADFDLAVIGPVVKETSDAFDLYWNHAAAIPIANLVHRHATPEQYVKQRAEMGGRNAAVEQSSYADSVHASEFARQLRNHAVTFIWGKASIVNDLPDKVITPTSRTNTHLTPMLREVIEQTKQELFFVSPYCIPGDEGFALLTDLRKRGARVVLITNSLASTDGVPVHAAYDRCRKRLLEAGIELYEIKPKPDVERTQRTDNYVQLSGARTSQGASLHAKTFSFDQRVGFVGSYNLDPRSNRLNTEMGVLFVSPELAKRIPETLARDLDQSTYHVTLDHHHIVWVTREGNKQLRYTSEPQAGLFRRLKSTLLRWVPIQGLL